MPTVFEKNGFRFFFYSADWVEPMHVHVECGDAKAKFWMKPARLASSYRMNAKDLKTARKLIEQHARRIEEAWIEHFSGKSRK